MAEVNFNVGDKVRIMGEHPHKGKIAKIVALVNADTVQCISNDGKHDFNAARGELSKAGVKQN